MAECMRTRILRDRLAVLSRLDDAGGYLCRLQCVLDDGDAMLDVAAAIREDEVKLVRGGLATQMRAQH